MKKYLLHLFILAGIGVIALPIEAQHSSSVASKISCKIPSHVIPNERSAVSSQSVYAALHSNPFPQSITVPGTDMMPVAGTFTFQSNGRSLHNVQIDPSNPLKMHAVITGTIDQTDADTSQYATRRCFYCYSSDGGKTWTNPSYFGQVKTGYADMQLIHRGEEWVPVIAAHQLPPGGGAGTLTGLWIEKGKEGDGNFSTNFANSTTMEGLSGQTIIWPTVAISPDGKTAYVIASVSTTGALQQLQFGTFSLVNSEGTPAAFGDSAIFNGWTAEPGAGDQNNPSAGEALGGAYRIRVSPSGKIGVFWKNNTNGDGGLYFAESADGGKTWPTTSNELVPLDFIAPTGGPNWSADGSVDFWYDGENPKFTFVGYDIGTGGTYYPYTTALYFWNPAVSSTPITVASGSLSAAQPNAIPNLANFFTGNNSLNLRKWIAAP